MTPPSRHRETDRRVAEKIFNRHVLEGKSNTMSCNCEKDHVIEARPYSTSISDAWAVVERMRELGWLMKLCQNGALNWDCDFLKVDEDLEFSGPVSHSRASAVELSICSSALSALQSGEGK